MSLQVGAKSLDDIGEQIKRYFDNNRHTEIVITRDEDGEFTITFD